MANPAMAVMDTAPVGLLIEYFAAPSDSAATRLLDRGPGDDGIQTPDLDPAVVLATLESTLTGVDEDIILDNPRLADAIAESGGSAIYTVTDELRDALAGATGDQLSAAAEVLAELEELDGADPETLGGLLEDLAELARGATEDEQHLYCWLTQ